MKHFAFLWLISGLVIPVAQSATVKNLEFDSDGVQPTSEPDIRLFNNTGLFETDLYNVSGGLLHQLTAGIDGSAAYNYPNNRLTNGMLDASIDLVMETRLRVLQISGRAGAFFEAYNGAHRASANFTNGGVVVRTDGGFSPVIPVALPQFHVYRLEKRGGSGAVRLLIDSNLVFEGLAPAHANLNGFSWGDGETASGAGADVDWDYVRVGQNPPAEPRVLHVHTDCVSNTVTVSFNLPVALDGSYTLDNGALVLSRAHGASAEEVVLATTALNGRTSYALAILGVHDLETLTHELAPNPAEWVVGCAGGCGDLTSRFGAGGAVTMEWNEPAGGLQSSTNLVTWRTLAGVRSPHVARPPLRAAEFFRLLCDVSGPVPAFIAQPDSRTVSQGATVTFGGAVIGAGPMSYQWLFFGTNLFGATNATLTLAGVNLGHMGVYELRATNAFGSVLSRPAYLDFPLPPDLPFNTLAAAPDVSVLLLGLNNRGSLALNTTVAEPDASVMLLGTRNTGGLAMNTTVAAPDVSLTVLGTRNTGSLPLNTTLAEPPVSVMLLGARNTGGLPANTTVAQPPVQVEVAP